MGSRKDSTTDATAPETRKRRAPAQKEGMAPPAPRARRKVAAADGAAGLSAEERHRLVAEAAYFIAERRGFLGGTELEDWLLAEAQIDGHRSAGKPAEPVKAAAKRSRRTTAAA